MTQDKSDNYDIVIIGAGIQGAGLAQAACAQGFNVLVLEKTAVAAGTSQKSSKLIHGGLRYLESFQFSLVQECLRERQLLLKLAPGLVKLTPFIIPVYKDSSRSPWKIRLGLFLYYCLSGFHPEAKFSSLPKSTWSSIPGLITDNLKAVFCYQDGQTNDKHLTQAVMDSAISMGCTLKCPADFTKSQINEDSILVSWRENNEEYQASAKVLVNCSGPWIKDTNNKLDTPLSLPDMELVKGSHIVLPEKISDSIFYVEAKDKRAVFIMPWGANQTLIGTTEQSTDINNLQSNDLETPNASKAEIQYLLQTASQYFPKLAHYTANTLEASFAGFRVLPKSSQKAFYRHRETLTVFDNPAAPRYVATAGGKLTNYRHSSEKLLDKLLPSLGRANSTPPKIATSSIPLTPRHRN